MLDEALGSVTHHMKWGYLYSDEVQKSVNLMSKLPVEKGEMQTIIVMFYKDQRLALLICFYKAGFFFFGNRTSQLCLESTNLPCYVNILADVFIKMGSCN